MGHTWLGCGQWKPPSHYKFLVPLIFTPSSSALNHLFCLFVSALLGSCVCVCVCDCVLQRQCQKKRTNTIYKYVFLCYWYLHICLCTPHSCVLQALLFTQICSTDLYRTPFVVSPDEFSYYADDSCQDSHAFQSLKFLNNPHTFILITVVFLQKSDWLLIEFLKFKVRITKSKMWTKGGETRMNE